LELSNNQIADISPLAKQTRLHIVLLERNKIADLAPLLKTLEADAKGEKRFAPYLEIYLQGNPLSDVAKAKQVPAIKAIVRKVESKRVPPGFFASVSGAGVAGRGPAAHEPPPQPNALPPRKTRQMTIIARVATPITIKVSSMKNSLCTL